MINTRVRTHFSKLAEEGVWASLYSRDQRLDSETWSFVIRARRVVELLQSSGTNLRKVVDLACGTAPVARSVVAMGAHYVGLDFSPDMVESARVHIRELIDEGRAEVRVDDVTAVSLSDGSCDAVLAMGVLEYLTLDTIDVGLREVFRILQPGGVAILTIPKRYHWGQLVRRVLRPIRRIVPRAPRRRRLAHAEEFQRLYLTRRELGDACRRAGLRKVDERHYNVQILSHPFTSAAPRITYLVNRPFEALARVPVFRFFATGYIGTYRRDSPSH